MSIYFDLQNNPVLITPNVLSVPKITAITYPGDDTAADTAGGQTITITGSGFLSGASIVINGSQVGVVTVVNSTTITFTSPAESAGSYVLYVVNTDGGTAVAVPGIQYSGTPVWSTAAGSLGSYTETQAIANTVTATGDAPITYSLYSGSLPTGATLNTSNGYISGTSPLEASPTTFTFTIRATDGQQQDTNRTFSLTINPDVVTWSSPANGTTYTSQANSAISNVNMSASGASGQSITYTANALPTGLSISGSNIYGTPTVVANSSTLLTATAATTNATATRTISWVITVANDPYFPYVTTLLSAYNANSNFITDASTNGLAITISGDTRPNNFNPYTPGYYSNYFDGSGDYLSVPNSSVFDFSGNDFTVECWAYWISGDFAVFSGANNNSTDLVYYSNSFRFGINNVSWNVTISYTLTAYRWYHIAFVQQSSVGKVYVNGSLIGSAANANNYNTNGGSMRINISGDGSRQGNVYFSNLRVVKGTAVYTSAFTPSTSPLTAIANTSLLTCQSNRLIDNSTNNFTITKNGDTTVSGFIPYTPNSSYNTYGSGYFDGTGDYLTVASSSNLSSSSNWSIEAWVYPTALALNNDYNIAYGPVNIYTESSQCYIVYWSSSGGTSQVGIGSLSQTLNNWMHIAFVNTASTGMKVYFNGTQIISRGAETITMGTTYIGANSSGGQRWTGYISGVRVINGGASPIYTTNFTPPTTPLTAVTNTQLLTLQNNQPNTNNMFVDISTSNRLVTRTGNSTQGAFSPYAGGFSNYFDGSGDYLTTPVFSSSAGSGLFTTGSTFTIEAWFYQTTYVTTSGYVNTIIGDLTPTTASALWWVVGTDSSNAPVYRWYDGSVKTCTGTIALGTNTWNHVAFVCNSGTLSIYVNGTSQSVTGTTTISTPAGNQSSLVIGADRGYYVTGYISNLRAVKNVAVYTTNFTTPSSPLAPVTGTNLLTCQSNRFNDSSMYNYTVTKYGDTKVQKFSPFSMQTFPAPNTYSVFFNARNGTYSAYPGDMLQFTGYTFGTTTFTVECWFNNTGSVWSSGNGTTSSLFGGNDSASALTVRFASSTTVLIEAAKGGASATFTLPTTLQFYTWYHFALVRNGTSMNVYINGVGSTPQTVSTNYSGSTSTIAVNYDSSNPNLYWWKGYLSNFRIVTDTAVYTGNFTPSTTPLTAIANTYLLTCQSSTLVDNSGNNLTITPFAYGSINNWVNTSKPVIVTVNPFGFTAATSAAYITSSLGGSMYFDGTGDYLTVPNSIDFSSTANWSIEAWVYPVVLSAGVYQVVLAGSGFTFGQYDTYCVVTNNSTGQISGVGQLVQGVWQHIALVNTPSDPSYFNQTGAMSLYLNGIFITRVGNASYTLGSTLYIGAQNGGGGSYWNGYISDLKMTYNNTSVVYQTSFTPPLSPMTAAQNTVLLMNGTSAGAYDNSMNADYECVSGGPLINTSTTKFGAGTSSMYFNGTYLASNQNSDLFYYNSGNFTAETWLYITATNSSSGIMGCWTNSSYNGWCIITSWNSNAAELRLYMYVGTGSAVNYDYTLNFPKNQWFHLAFVKNSTTFTTYVNGVSQISYGSSVAAGTGPLYIGAGAGLNSNAFQTPFGMNGYMSDVRITKGVARYTSTFTPPTSPFVRL